MSDTDRPTTPGRVVKPPPAGLGWRSVVLAGVGMGAAVCIVLGSVGIMVAFPAAAADVGPVLTSSLPLAALAAVVACVWGGLLGKDLSSAIEAVAALAGAWRR